MFKDFMFPVGMFWNYVFREVELKQNEILQRVGQAYVAKFIKLDRVYVAYSLFGLRRQKIEIKSSDFQVRAGLVCSANYKLVSVE